MDDPPTENLKKYEILEICRAGKGKCDNEITKLHFG